MTSIESKDRSTEFQLLEHDICSLYQILGEYCHIMGDLDYGSKFSLKYWNYLDIRDESNDRLRFIRQGCLMFLLAMSWDSIDGSGDFMRTHIDEILPAIDACSSTHKETQKLIHTVRTGLELVSTGHPETAEFSDLSDWAYQQFVNGYFSTAS